MNDEDALPAIGNPRPAGTATIFAAARTILLPAVLLTLLNAAKPLAVDDVAYYFRAAQIVKAPCDPYGGEPWWDQNATPAIKAFAPPMLSYWWALGMRLGGDRELWWHVWQLPIALLFTAMLYQLLHRFAEGVERPVLWLTAFSPAFLPGFNFMTDLPAIALSMAAIACFLHAAEHRSFRAALLAGLIAGVGMQIKYTAVTAVVAMLAHGWFARRLRLSTLAAAAAAAVFIGCELVPYVQYGISPFVGAIAWRGEAARKVAAAALVVPLATIVGCVAPALVPLGLTAQGRSSREVLRAIILIAAAYLLLAIVPVPYSAWFPVPGENRFRLGLHNFTVDLIGLPLWWIAGVVLWKEYVSRWRGLALADRFLLLWLAIEIVFYFPLTPFSAARRVMGIVLVVTLLLARIAARHVGCQPQRSRQLWAAAALSISAGVLFWAVDVYDARCQRAAVQQAVAYLETRGGGGTRWFAAHWGFQYYARRAGMLPMVLGQSQLKAGDWLIIPRLLAGYSQRPPCDPDKLALATEYATGEPMPLTVENSYYCGKHPLTHRLEPEVITAIYRITGDCIPRERK